MFLKKKWYLESKSYRTILRSTAKARTNEKKKKEEKKERKKESINPSVTHNHNGR